MRRGVAALAAFVAMAVLFAPGQAAQPSRASTGSVDLSAAVLAPTFDEGATKRRSSPAPTAPTLATIVATVAVVIGAPAGSAAPSAASGPRSAAPARHDAGRAPPLRIG